MEMLDKITAKIDKIVLLFAVLVLVVSFYLVYSLNLSYSKKEAVQSLDNALLLTKNILEEEQQHVMSLSLLLSQDKSFLESFYAQDRKAAFDTINEKMKTLQKIQGYTFEVQVHDKNLHTYLRNWDYTITDVPLASFREGLVLVKQRKKPMVSIEVGKRLNIKAISPILKEGAFQGSIEVIEGFGHLREKLAEQGYALFILLDKQYFLIATSLKHHPLIANRFVLVNDIYDKNSYQGLKNADLSNLGTYGYFTRDKFAFGYFDIKNYQDDRLGYCIIAVEKDVPLSIESYQGSDSVEYNSSGVIIR